jgi:V/A-type H+-transporting ATPase subunit A
MMRLLSRFIELSQQAIERRVDIENITSLPILRRLRRMNEDIGEDNMDKFETLRKEIENIFAKLVSEAEQHAG